MGGFNTGTNPPPHVGGYWCVPIMLAPNLGWKILFGA